MNRSGRRGRKTEPRTHEGRHPVSREEEETWVERGRSEDSEGLETDRGNEEEECTYMSRNFSWGGPRGRKN